MKKITTLLGLMSISLTAMASDFTCKVYENRQVKETMSVSVPGNEITEVKLSNNRTFIADFSEDRITLRLLRKPTQLEIEQHKRENAPQEIALEFINIAGTVVSLESKAIMESAQLLADSIAISCSK